MGPSWHMRRISFPSHAEPVVSPGASLAAGDTVAVIHRLPGRLVRLRAAEGLSVPPEILFSHVLVGPETLVETGEPVAAAVCLGYPMVARAEHAGHVAMVSKTRGFVYMRQSLPTIAKESPPAVVPIPAQGVPEATLREFMMVREGDRVQSGQTLVSLNALRLYRRDYSVRGAPSGGGCVAPVDGVVDKVDLRRLTVTIEPAVTQTAITAGIPGVVSAVHRNGIDLMVWGEVFTGVYGTGGEALGPLTFGAEAGLAPGPGAVWALPGRVTASQLDAARANGVRAVWAASATYEDLREFLGDRPLGTVSLAGAGPVVVISEGFGDLWMPPRVAAALAASAGRTAAVNGDTQLRAGVIRPELLILHDVSPAASPADGRPPEQPAPEPRPLAQGDLVRCAAGRNLGRTGRVAAVPRPGLLPSGVSVELAEVAWDDGGRDTVACRNLARVSGEWGDGNA